MFKVVSIVALFNYKGIPLNASWANFLSLSELVIGVGRERKSKAAGRAGVGQARMIPRARNAWLAQVAPNVWFIYLCFSSEAEEGQSDSFINDII